MYDQMAIGIGIWIRSSVIAILSLFSICILIASFIAEELESGMDKALSNLSKNDKSQFSTQLEKWLKKFHLCNRFVEGINDCFGLILLITLSHMLLLSIYYWFRIVRKWNGGFLPDDSSPLPLVELSIYLCQIILLYFRFFVILINSHQLQNKVY